jgi:hypothetical protein
VNKGLNVLKVSPSLQKDKNLLLKSIEDLSENISQNPDKLNAGVNVSLVNEIKKKK